MFAMIKMRWTWGRRGNFACGIWTAARRNEPYRCTKCEVDIHSRVVKRKGDRKVESAIIFPTGGGHLRLFRINRERCDPLPHPFPFISLRFSPAFLPRVILLRYLCGWYTRTLPSRAPTASEMPFSRLSEHFTGSIINSLWVKIKSIFL